MQLPYNTHRIGPSLLLLTADQFRMNTKFTLFHTLNNRKFALLAESNFAIIVPVWEFHSL